MRRPSEEAQTQKAVFDPGLHSSGISGRHHLDGLGGRVSVMVSAQPRGDERSPNLDRDANGHNHLNRSPHSHPHSHIYIYLYTYLHPYAHAYAPPNTDANIYTYLHPYDHPYDHAHDHLDTDAYQNPLTNPNHLLRYTWRYPFLDSRQIWRHDRGHLGSQQPECINHPEHRAKADHPLSWVYRRDPS